MTSLRPRLPVSPIPQLEVMTSYSVYMRLWSYLLEHWHVLPMDKPKRRRPLTHHDNDSMRRIHMLQELEERGLTHHERRRRRQERDDAHAIQTTCVNCERRCFKSQSVASSTATSTFCSLDCRSSFEYRSQVQQSIDQHGAFASSYALKSTATTLPDHLDEDTRVLDL